MTEHSGEDTAVELARIAVEERRQLLERALEEGHKAAKLATSWAFVPAIAIEATGMFMIAAALGRPLFLGDEELGFTTTEFMTILVIGALLLLFAPFALVYSGNTARERVVDTVLDEDAKSAARVAALEAQDQAST